MVNEHVSQVKLINVLLTHLKNVRGMRSRRDVRGMRRWEALFEIG
jgi:hypothetical protein